MATRTYFSDSVATMHRGDNTAQANGVNSGWRPYFLKTTAGPSTGNTAVVSTVSGPTNGLEIQGTGGPREWISEPLAADVTISGSITFNLVMSESSMSANAGAQCIIERLNSLGDIVSTVINSEKGTELPTSAAAQNWSGTPTSTNFLRGDRIRIRVLANDAGGTMATGFSVSFSFNATAGSANDSWVEFTENLTFETADPTGTTHYLRQDSATGLTSDSVVRKKAATSRGAERMILPASAVAGWTAPSQFTYGPLFILSGTALNEWLYGGTAGSVEPNQQLAQGFHIWSSVSVNSINLKLSRVGTPLDNLVVDIVSSLGGTALGTSTPVVASTVSTVPTSTAFSFAVSVSLDPGDYFLVLRRTGLRDTANYILWSGGNSGDNFGDGAPWSRDSLTWTQDVTRDLQFSIPQAAVVVEWYSEQLEAFTLGGKALFKLWAFESSTAANTSLRGEVAIVDADGTNASVWGAANAAPSIGNTSITGELSNNTSGNPSIYVSGPDTSVTQGKRLRYRVYLDDTATDAAVANGIIELHYNGPTASALGDSYVILPQTVTEYSAVTPSDPPIHLLQRQPYKTLIVR